jgi:hypothetical protein
MIKTRRTRGLSPPDLVAISSCPLGVLAKIMPIFVSAIFVNLCAADCTDKIKPAVAGFQGLQPKLNQAAAWVGIL